MIKAQGESEAGLVTKTSDYTAGKVEMLLALRKGEGINSVLHCLRKFPAKKGWFLRSLIASFRACTVKQKQLLLSEKKGRKGFKC